jgi:small conductance mechanosensitive channel
MWKLFLAAVVGAGSFGSGSTPLALDVASAAETQPHVSSTPDAPRPQFAAVKGQSDPVRFEQREASDRKTEVIDDHERIEQLQNPFTLGNMAQWLHDYGPKLLAILLGTLATYVAVRLSGRHLAKLVARTSTRGSLHERENRALTLVGVFRNIASIAVIAVGLLMALEAVGIPIVPLMGGAAVVGLAVAFGAQNLVRDYFAGFMVLLEDQYGINDVVKIGDIAGAVEQITLRVTTLRDLEGIVHFVPHGTITTVSNMTHGWSRALLEIGVAYKEDTDRVMDVMLEVARELRNDSAFGPFILGDPEMLGVDSFGDSAVLIKMCIKTQPLKRWAVKRELLRRVKHKFDELGIEIPFPHRTLFLREAEGESREAIRRN